jgi:hypothetical protein
MRANVLIAALMIGSGLIAAGCETQEIARVGPEPREQIAYAATARYPAETARTPDSFKVAAVDDVEDKTLTIMNLSDGTIPPSTAWVNGAYVYQLPTIPPRGMYEIDYKEILMTGPNPSGLARSGQAVRKVELQTHEGLFTVQGPSKKTD